MIQTDAVMALAKKMGMFDANDLAHIQETLDNTHNGITKDLWFVADDNGLKGVLYCAPEPMTKGTWNVLMLLVDPDHQGQGYGSKLMQAAEQALIAQGDRLLIVETSSLDAFEGARAFYAKCGFTQEARIRDFYEAGNDKIIFRKTLIKSK